MANDLDAVSQFEYQRAQLAASLSAVAETMRNCASIAEQFANVVKQTKTSVAHVTQGSEHGISGHADADGALSKGRKRKAGAADDDDDKKKRGSRKPRDPNAPKRPPSSYIMFQNEVRKEIKEKHPSISNPELLALISKQWNEMSEEQKAVYIQATASAKEKYTADKKAYENRTPAEIAAANAVTEAEQAAKKAKKTKAPKAAKAQIKIQVVPKVAEPVSETAETSPGSEHTDESSGEESSEEEQPALKLSKTLAQSRQSDSEESDVDEDSDEDDEEEEEEPRKRQKTMLTVTPNAKSRKGKSSK